MKLLDRGADLSDKMTERVTRQTSQLLDRLLAAMETAQAMREPLKAQVVDQVRTQVRDRLNLGPRRTRRFTAMTLIVGTGIGYLAAYLFDPAHGATRRQHLREQLRTAARRTTQVASDQVQTVSSTVSQKVGRGAPQTTELGTNPGLSARVDEVVGNGEKIPATPGGSSRITPTTPL